jgi:hypothetical protein
MLLDLSARTSASIVLALFGYSTPQSQDDYRTRREKAHLTLFATAFASDISFDNGHVEENRNRHVGLSADERI